MVAQTSIIAFKQIKDSGLVGNMQQLVWLKLYEDGPMTAGEVCDALKMDGIPTRASFNAKNRLSELKRLGIVIERPARLCRITKRPAKVWCAVAGKPVRPEPAPTCPTCGKAMK